uniref:Troponin I 4 n=1 Tax=Steinernema glaseri TaxID=37863 RepID=A0A1I7YB07_9BILA
MAADPELLRYGGPQNDSEDEEEKKAAELRERKKAEVRKRLEEASRAKKSKKGFLTPERKKKLRKLLMMKTAEALRQKQEEMERERQRILQERIMPLPDLDSFDEDELQTSLKEMYDRVVELESESYDINLKVRAKDFEINELTIAVNDLRGKFVKPTLKKVSKTEGKFNKLKKKEGPKVDFRAQLKMVDTQKFTMKEDEGKGAGKAEWAK